MNLELDLSGAEDAALAAEADRARARLATDAATLRAQATEAEQRGRAIARVVMLALGVTLFAGLAGAIGYAIVRRARSYA